ncbi:MAG: GNAT family N-acetyltransferase, partial [Byssovorax sp.]
MSAPRYVPLLDRSEIDEAARQNQALWGYGRSEAEHLAHTAAQLAHAGPELLRYVGLVSEQGLVAASKRYGLLFRAGGREARVLGIGAVFTKESERGKGHAPALIRAMVREARDLGYAAAVLYSDIDAAYYARLGFIALPAVDCFALPCALPDADALPFRPAEEGDLDRLIAWHEASWASSPGASRPMRSRALFRFFQWRNRVADAWILGDAGRDAGYLLAGLDDPQRDLPEPRPDRLLWVDEWSAPGVDPARVLATIRAVADRSRALKIGLWPRPGQDLASLRSAARLASFPMILPIAPGLVVDPLRDHLGSFEHF